MSFLGNIIGGGASSLIHSIADVADKFITTDDERSAFKMHTQKLIASHQSELEQTIRKELEAKERVLMAELRQDDNYTKRARPTIVYAGLLFIFVNYTIAPAFGLGSMLLPSEFWMAWGGICGTWAIGRSAEKIGVKNKFIQSITGNSKSILDL